MYIPKHFEMAQWSDIQAFVADMGAIDLVTVDPTGQPVASLLPGIWMPPGSEADGFGTLIMHMARLNDQWKSVTDQSKALGIVHGPQAYISPSNYHNKNTDRRTVPTWNYQSVHFEGTLTISDDPEKLRKIVTELTDFHEDSRSEPWHLHEADEKYVAGQLKAIVAVVMQISAVHAKEKLSQNRSEKDQLRIIEDLNGSAKGYERDIAQAMSRKQESSSHESD